MNEPIQLPKRLERNTVYKSNRMTLYTDSVLMPSGHIIEKYHQLEFANDSVVMVIQNLLGEICLIQSKRYSTQKIEWELPAGGIDNGEKIIDAARREVKEETGLIVENLKVEYKFNPLNSISNKLVYIVSGVCKEVKNISKIDEDEVLGVTWKTKDDVSELIKNNEINDGISLLAILLAFHK